MLKALKSIFGGSRKEPSAKAKELPEGPMGLRLGSAVRMDLMKLAVNARSLAVASPAETLVISGHGRADMGDGTVVHRFYDDSHVVLQVVCEHGVGPECVREVMVFQPWDSVVPQSAAEWAVWDSPGGHIGAATYDADGLLFQRHWGDPGDEWIPPVEFTETVLTDEGERMIHQKVVAYRRRPEGFDEDESLLLSIERDLESGDRGSVEFMIGYGLSPADVKAV